MGSKSSKVMTPRNVELPLHVFDGETGSTVNMMNGGGGKRKRKKKLRGEEEDSSPSRRKCLCLAAWLAGLVLLCLAVLALGGHLLPAGRQAGGPSSDRGAALAAAHGCLENAGASLGEKVAVSDLVVVGRLSDDGASLRVRDVLKGRFERPVMAYDQKGADDCAVSRAAVQAKKIFFLSQESPPEEVAVPRFRALPASAKLTGVLRGLAGNGE